jgi:hypothetical protein
MEHTCSSGGKENNDVDASNTFPVESLYITMGDGRPFIFLVGSLNIGGRGGPS